MVITACHSARVTSVVLSQNGREMVTVCWTSLGSRPASSGGEPITNVPGGMRT